ncbi:winged helix-turn-helix domain-containing protein [Parvularcula oceani]|uniref:winged helix-turn-helix domain-containing protein n=1 Tax=Parvularcula oceani TaxID=1247963 RepID=UPI0004E1F899|nr:winged helix-turn-helix domain-containing protein [Parvularcula oceani]
MSSDKDQAKAEGDDPVLLDKPFLVGPHLVTPSRNRLGSEEDARTIQPKIMRLLCLLAADPGRTFSRHELVEHVWEGVIVSDAAIDRAICNLRKALGDSARYPIYVETIRKRGVRLMVVVEAAQARPPRRAGRERPQGRIKWGSKVGFGLTGAAVCAVATMLLVSPGEPDEASVMAEAAIAEAFLPLIAAWDQPLHVSSGPDGQRGMLASLARTCSAAEAGPFPPSRVRFPIEA